MIELIPAILAGISAIAGPTVAWWITKRKSSGRVDTSEARDLWDEAKDIRSDLRGEIQKIKEENIKLRADNLALTLENFRLKRELEEIQNSREA